MICQDCSSTEFRISRFRWADLERLALLQYPVRCRKCHRRAFAGLPLALVMFQAPPGEARQARTSGDPLGTRYFKKNRLCISRAAGVITVTGEL